VTTCEADLIRHAAYGDQEAFRQLWEAHHAAAMAAALRLRAGGRDHPGSVSAGLARFLLIGIGLLAVVALIVCWIHRLPLVGAPLALALWTVAAWSWQRQARSLAFRADTLMVRWLGRGPACSGLHALAQRSRAPRGRRWGEPSLDERIERVCGTGVEERREPLDARRVRRSKDTERISR